MFNIISNDEESIIKQLVSSLAVNDNKTVVIELPSTLKHADNIVIQGYTFYKMCQFTYLGTTISDINGWSIKLNDQIETEN